MRSIVVPVDGSALAKYALMPAAELARRHEARPRADPDLSLADQATGDSRDAADDRALRVYALELGLTSEPELEESPDRDGPQRGGPG